ncbi:2'-5' RNA ligase family protein [Micromonospora sp. WMMA1923]|uniref:2'-5' RNA ligase family protein n=1 Tax=Micromonospora sp. WMMA1923 TaxID=3404125 RepID=UPI003B9668D1
MTSREHASLQQRWSDYQRLSTLTEHWYWRPGWQEGRQFYTWHLTFEYQPLLHELVTHLQSQLVMPGLDPVPLDALHLTMQGVGFTDHVTDSDLDRIVEHARTRCADLPAPELTLGPVDPDAEGIGLLVQPWDQVERLRTAIREAIGTVWDTVPEAAQGFRPHVTIAYSGSSTAAAPIRDRLTELRHIPGVTVRIREASLIALRREDHTYRWTTIATASIGGTNP